MDEIELIVSVIGDIIVLNAVQYSTVQYSTVQYVQLSKCEVLPVVIFELKQVYLYLLVAGYGTF